MLLYFLIIAVVFLLAIQFFIVFRRRRQLTKRDFVFIKNEWETIRQKVGEHPRHAVMEADTLLDFVLKRRGFGGSMADKLKKAEASFSHIDNVWHAHKLRNRIAHEVGFRVSEDEARKALSAFKQAMWDLGVKL